MTELKPCAHNEENLTLIRYRPLHGDIPYRELFYVFCQNCRTQLTHAHHTEEEAIDELKRRAGKPMTELKPCKCGGEAVEDRFMTPMLDWVVYKPYIRCKACGARTDEYDTPEQATEAWNRRVKE